MKSEEDKIYTDAYFNESSLKKRGIGHFEMWKSTETNGFEKIYDLDTKISAGKTVRIFFISKIDHDDFINLLIASQPFVIVTGDQSLSEALSATKIIQYKPPGHKDVLCRNLKDLCLTLNNKAAAENFNGQGFVSAEKVGTPEMKESFRQLADVIYKDHNLGKNITRLIMECLSKMHEVAGDKQT